MQSADEIKSTTTQVTGLAAELEKVGKISDRLKGNFKETLNTVSNFDTKLISNARNLGQSAAYAKSVENELGRAAVNVVKMGGSLEDVIKTFTEINTAIGRTTYLSQQFYENVEAIEKHGVKGETISSFGDNSIPFIPLEDLPLNILSFFDSNLMHLPFFVLSITS